MSSYMTFPISVVAFASIIFWLVTREPAEDGMASTTHPQPKIKETASTPTSTPEQVEVIALSDTAHFVREELNQTILPVFQIKNASLEDSIDAFRLGFKENSNGGYGLSFIIRHNPPNRSMDSPITIDEKNIPAKKVLDLICHQTNHRWEIEEHGIVLTPLD